MVEKIELRKSSWGMKTDKSLKEVVADLPIGTYNIYVTEVGYITTSSQRKLFWMWMTQLEYWSGQSRIDWHDHYVNKFIPPYKHGISDISTRAMTHFMRQVQADATAEYGVILPLPEDSGYNEFVLEFKNL